MAQQEKAPSPDWQAARLAWRLRGQERKLRPVGGSVSVTLPAAFVKTLGWPLDGWVFMRLEGKSIIIE